MNCYRHNHRARGGRQSLAMSLIELIGALALLAVMGGMMIPFGIRTIDRIVAEREVSTLATLGDSFRNAILRSRQITNAVHWPDVIATEAGMDRATVAQNARRNPRAFLYDKGGWLNTALPYRQTNSTPPGLSTLPGNARVMIVSSLGRPLPATLNNTDISAADFAALWDTPENLVPSSGPWVGWEGRSDDVKVQRVNLASLFVNLVLSTYAQTNLGRYRIDSSAPFVATDGAGVAAYFFKGTTLDLFSSPPESALQHTHVLDCDTSFVYENNAWRSSILGAVATGMGDASAVVEAFLKSPENMRAANTNGMGIQQYIIVTNFIAYMSNYNVWELKGFPSGSLQDHLKGTLQPAMMKAVNDIFLYSGGSDNHLPINNDPCL
jgi:type II secretory pathway pseudopilin PulG